MSGICGFVGAAPPSALTSMLDAIAYRGDSSDTESAPNVALGYRFWSGRANKSSQIFRSPASWLACAGTLTPHAPFPAAALDQALSARDTELDGAFAAARWDIASETLTLIRDPFGVRSLY